MSAMKLVAYFLALGMSTCVDPKHRGSLVSMLRSKDSVTPMEKVITLIEELKSEVEDEAKEEAKAYDKFACFCKDTTKDKSEAIKDGYSEIDDLTATIEEKTAEQEKATEELAEFHKKIDEISMEIKKLKEERRVEKAENEAIIEDLELAITQAKKAIKVLKEAKPSFVEVKKMIQKSMVFIDALGISPKHRRAINAFLQGADSDEPPGEYESKTDEIIDAIKDLKKDMKEHKDKKVEEEEKAQKAYEKLLGKKEEKLEAAEEGAKDCEETIDECKEAIAEAEGKLTEEEAEMKDNQLYLKDLTERCEVKARQWDQRTKARAEEVEALASALETLKDVKEAKRALIQSPVKGKKASALLSQKIEVDQDVSAGAGAGEDDVGSSALSFMQRESQASPKTVAHRLLKGQQVKPASNDRHANAAALLASEGKRLKSTLLVSTATQVEAMSLIGPDPFKKIKILIQNLIDKLLQQMKDEATHKGFCDEEMGKAKNSRDSAHVKTQKLNAELMELEVAKDETKETIETLTKELDDLEESLKKTTKMREDEKEENAATIKESKEGAEAVAEAIKVLQEFYGKGAAFLQASPIDEEGEAPDAGFGDAPYKGKGAAAGGILGMLEVIKSDFERSIKQTTEEETKAHRGFVDFDRQTKVSIMDKETGKEQAKTDLKSIKIALDEGFTDLEDTQKLLDESLKELEELNPQCVDTGMSYEERVAAREAEIEALKKALDILKA